MAWSVINIVAVTLGASLSPNLDRIKIDDAPLGAPTIGGVVYKGEERNPLVITLFRRLQPSGAHAWIARSGGLADRSQIESINSQSCARLAEQVEKLSKIEAGPIYVPMGPQPPVFTVHADLYTVWGRASRSGGAPSFNEVSTTSGPIADWARELRETLKLCGSLAE